MTFFWSSLVHREAVSTDVERISVGGRACLSTAYVFYSFTFYGVIHNYLIILKHSSDTSSPYEAYWTIHPFYSPGTKL